MSVLPTEPATLADGALPAGIHRSVWDASVSGDLPGGVYHAKMTVTGPAGSVLFSGSRKLLLIR